MCICLAGQWGGHLRKTEFRGRGKRGSQKEARIHHQNYTNGLRGLGFWGLRQRSFTGNPLLPPPCHPLLGGIHLSLSKLCFCLLSLFMNWFFDIVREWTWTQTEILTSLQYQFLNYFFFNLKRLLSIYLFLSEFLYNRYWYSPSGVSLPLMYETQNYFLLSEYFAM